MTSYRKQLKDKTLSLINLATTILDTLLLINFIVKGKIPFIRGYDIFKRRAIQKALTYAHFSREKLPVRYGQLIDERIIEYPWFFSRLPSSDTGRLLDAGSVLNFDYILNHKSLKNKDLFISTLAPETEAYWEKGVSYVYEDLRATCFNNDYFDWIVSLSTLEHVGMDNTAFYTDDTSKKEANEGDYLQVVSEFRRILKPGGVCYLSIPFGARKVHEWLQVFDAAMVDAVIHRFEPADYSVSYYRYSPRKGWAVVSAEQCADAIYHDFHKNGRSREKPAAAEAVVCIEMRK